MFSFNELKIIQIEITNRCQASCPMCLRNVHGGIENPLLHSADWTLEHFKNVFNLEVLTQINKIVFCGDFGDPIINNDLIAMCRYVKENSNVSIQVHTNGSARSIEWWQKLAKAMPADHKIEFALDGLADTHSLYRIGTDFNKILDNAKAFIRAGGTATWMFIKFKHNEHQVQAANALAKEHGFKEFKFKSSKRFGKNFPVLNSDGTVSHYLEQHTGSDIKPVEFNDLKDYKQWQVDIDCFALNDKELYIDAHGHIMPCCLIASFLYANYDERLHKQYNLIDKTSIVSLANEVQTEVYDLVSEFGGFDSLDTNKHTIKDIMSTEVWQTLMHKKWKDCSSSPCSILCGKTAPFIKVKDQINREV
jgi:hypothetical protein